MRAFIVAISLLVLGSPVFGMAISSPQAVSALAGKGCELVELFPGYPGYMGFVTGVDGVGDHACLEDLEDQDRSFDREDEDDANLDAAQTLGINGGPELWTWENWLAIEAERGMTPTCYTCLFDETNSRSEPTDTEIAPNDPRLLLGPFVGFQLEAIVSNGRVSNNQYENFFFRSIAYASNPGSHLNAAEVLEEAELYWAITNSRGGTPTNWDMLWRSTLSQGGYAPTPATSSADDQVWLVMAMFWTFANLGLNPWASDAVLRMNLSPVISEWIDDWEAGRTDLTFAEYASNQQLNGWTTC